MDKHLEEILQEAVEAIAAAPDSRALYEAKMRFLGRMGRVAALYKKLKELPPEERPAFGQQINDLRRIIEERAAELDEKLRENEMGARLATERVDVTMPGRRARQGALHPVTRVRNQLIDIFAGMGFEIFEGPEIENDYYNFTALNTPADHPARDMQDTFYVADGILLRTQTSAGQIRLMEKKKPPIKMLSPGRVFRSDDDATHSPMFHQMEGLVVDKHVTLCDLQGMLDEFARVMFSESSRTRLRPSYFPFTEPSTAASTPTNIRVLRSAWASSASPCSNTASTTSNCSPKTTCVFWNNLNEFTLFYPRAQDTACLPL